MEQHLHHHQPSISTPTTTVVNDYHHHFIILITFLLLLFLFRHRRLIPFTSLFSCKCNICHNFRTRTYLTSGFRNLPDWYTHLLRHSHTSTITIHLLNNVVTANPRNVEHILHTNFDNYPKGRPHSIILGDLLGRGIFIVDGEHWRFQRKLASFELGSNSIRQFAFAVLSSEVQSRLIPVFKRFVDEEIEVDLQDVFRRFSFDNICRFSFGIDPGCLRKTLPESEFAEAFDLASKLSAERALHTVPWIWKVKRVLNLGSERKLKKAVKKVHFLAETIIRERRKMGVSGRRDLLSRFMTSITDEEYLRDIVINFLLAGRDTVASAITVFFLLLSQNPETESKIRAESDRVLGTNTTQVDRVPRYEQLKDLHYLHAAMYESLRLYPPVQIDSKYAVSDDTLPDGTKVKGGSKVSFHPYAMGRMSQIWGDDCMDFKPERWIDEDGVFKVGMMSAYEFPVFQAGFRVCLGKEMAVLAMKVVCLSIVRLFDVRVVGGSVEEQPEFVPGLTATLRAGLKAVVRKREWR